MSETDFAYRFRSHKVAVHGFRDGLLFPQGDGLTAAKFRFHLFEDFRNAVNKTAQSIWSVLKPALENLWGLFQNIWNIITYVVEKMGEVSGYVFEAPGERCLYLAADTIFCSEVEKTIRKYHPEVIILNCCEATTPLGRLIMNLSDIEKTCTAAPQAIVIASHLDSVNHALLTRKDIMGFAKEKGLSGGRVPEDGQSTVL